MANYFLSMLTSPYRSDSWRRHRRRSRSLHRNHVSSSGRHPAAPSSREPFNGPPPAPRRADALSAPLAFRRGSPGCEPIPLLVSRFFSNLPGYALRPYGLGMAVPGPSRLWARHRPWPVVAGPGAFRARGSGSATAASGACSETKPATRTVCLPVLDYGLGYGPDVPGY